LIGQKGRALSPLAGTIAEMTDPYYQLLEATIQHLEGLKRRGERCVSVSPE